MARKCIAIKNSFNDVVRINPKTFSYFAVWDQGHHINFWDKAGPCIGNLHFTPDTFDTESEQVFLQLRGNGMDFIRLASGTDPDGVPDDGYRFYYRPEFIEYFEDDTHKESPSQAVALSIGGVPFYLSEDEKADFKHALFSKTPAKDWLQFSKEPGAQFNSASGHYAFRKSLITDMFANKKDGLLAIQTPDRYRTFVPMAHPEKIIDAVAKELPQLVKSDAPATAYPLYYDPSVYPAEKRHHVHIILRR